MGGYQTELSFRLGAGFNAVAWSQLVNLILERTGFDDETHFELVLETSANERQAHDVQASEFARLVNPETWPELHQIVLTNQWIKDMNVKLHWVNRGDHAVLSVKLDLADSERRQQLAAAIKKMLASSQTEEGMGPHHQERERLFGALLLADSVVSKTRAPFLAGNFRAALTAGWELLEERLKSLLPYKPGLEHRILEFLKQDPPPVLFPNLAGAQLRQELDGLAHLLTGFLTLLRPVIEGKDKQSEDPAVALKCLVLLSLLVARLESMVPNPVTGKTRKTAVASKPKRKAAKKKPTPSGRVKVSRPVAVKKVARKSAKKHSR